MFSSYLHFHQPLQPETVALLQEASAGEIREETPGRPDLRPGSRRHRLYPAEICLRTWKIGTFIHGPIALIPIET
jgi:hypothetical protein